MARVRWRKTLAQVQRDAERHPERLDSRIRSLRVVYETDPAVAAAVVPRPLEPAPRPEVGITFSHVAIELAPGTRFELGSAIVGVRVRYDGVEGLWLLTMPMTSEQAVIGGRETWGEPKKLAAIDLRVEGDEVSASVTRMGVAYLAARGRLGADRGPRELLEHGFCVKTLPACEPGRGLEGDAVLVRLDWRHRHERVREVLDGELALRESPFDPVADLPVRRLLRMEYEEGSTESGGRALRTLPSAWVLPILHQRYDEPGAEGIEV